jgi:C4-type Zn-finger protein
MERECPMCGEFMRLVSREVITRLPGSPQVVRTIVREWICKECDFFEEAEDETSPAP